MIRPFSTKRILLTAGLLAASTIAGSLDAHSAHANLIGCRSDPKVFLTDGTVVTLTSLIAASPGNIAMVDYSLHVPQGVGVKRVVYTGHAFTRKESVTTYTDDAANTYDSTTTVYLRTPGKNVIANLTAVSRTMGTSGTNTASGMDQQPIPLHTVVTQNIPGTN